jgi:hypothetical protein
MQAGAMITTSQGRPAALLLAALLAGFAFAARAQAPEPARPDMEAAKPAETIDLEVAKDDAAMDDDILKDVDVSKLDWSQLDTKASPLTDRPASKAQARAAAPDVTWSARSNPNGSSAVAVKQSLSPFWDTRIGADMTVARPPTTMSELLSEKISNGGSLPQSSGTAWAAITAPGAGLLWDKTAVEARLDPGQDQGRLGTSLSKSLPLDERYSLTLQNAYNWIQQGTVPGPGLAARPLRSYETEQSAKLSITDTGTSLIAGQSLSSGDDRWLRRFGAEQKLSDDISISASIGETSQGTVNKSVSAGFKRSW